VVPRPRRERALVRGALGARLLEADPATLRLLRDDPFDGARPRRVRAVVYRYRYTTPTERRRTGAWWVRHERGVLVDPLDLAAMARLTGPAHPRGPGTGRS